MEKSVKYILCFLVLSMSVNAQVLTLEDAIKIAMEKNHSIVVSKINNAANNKDVHIGKTGLLPKVDAVAGGNYSSSTTDVTFAGNIPPLDGANAVVKGYNAGVQVSYLLFDGLGTFRSYKKIKTMGEISDVQTKISIESTLMQLVANYYEVVRNQELEQIYKSTLELSKQRLEKAEYNFSYGSASKIDVLNAKVDYNTDESNYLNQAYNLNSAKRQLNYLLGQEMGALYEVISNVEITVIEGGLDSLKQKVLNNNTSLLLSQLNVSAAEIDNQLAKSQFAPKISMNASYGLNYSENSASIMLKSSSLGFTGALSMSWNLFNGLNRKKELEKSKLIIEASESKKAQAIANLEKEFLNIFDGLSLSIQLIKLAEESIKSATLNLEKSQELYSNGSLTNVQFRQAQLNLLIAKSKFNNLKFQAKIQEFQLKRLTNELIQ